MRILSALSDLKQTRHIRLREVNLQRLAVVIVMEHITAGLRVNAAYFQLFSRECTVKRTVIGIVPTLIGLMAAVGVLRSSGFLEDFGKLFGTVLEPAGIPSALVPLGVVRLFSNSAAVSLLLDLYKEAGCDSFAGRAASIMMSCTETVFYTMAVYFGAVHIKKTRYTLAGALLSSLVGMAVSIALAGLL